MKNLTMNLMIAATALVAAAGSASAQTMEAKIPFAFRASGKVLPAGTYRVELKSAQSGDRVVLISTAGGKNQTLATAYQNGPASASRQAAGNAVLSFQCGVSRCALKDIWMGAAETVYRLPVQKLGKDEPMHTAEIVMSSVKGD
jgi:hypothetical protein